MKTKTSSTHATATTPVAACDPATRVTKSLLAYGVIVGPLYVGVSLAQALTRQGFDLTRHPWSLPPQRQLRLDPDHKFPAHGRDDDRVRGRGRPGAGPRSGYDLAAAPDSGSGRSSSRGRGVPGRSRTGLPAGDTVRSGADQLARRGAPCVGQHRLRLPDHGLFGDCTRARCGGAPALGKLHTDHRWGVPGQLRRDRGGWGLLVEQPDIRRWGPGPLYLDVGDSGPPVPPRRTMSTRPQSEKLA
jgi:hypothetical protein